MKKLLFIAIALLLVASCGKQESTDKEACYKSVRGKFPNAKIYKDYEHDYTFYVVDSTGVKVVKTMNSSDAEVSSVSGTYELK